MLGRIKKFLIATPDGRRITHYVEIFSATFGLAAIAASEHFASLHQPLTSSVLLGIGVAGAKAAIDLGRPLVVGWLTGLLTKG